MDNEKEAAGKEGAPESIEKKDGVEAPDSGAAPGKKQDKPWWEERGYKTEADAIQSLEEAQRTISELKERQAQMERTLHAVAGGKEEGEGKKGAAGYKRYFEGQNLAEAYADPEAYATSILAATHRMVQDVSQEIVDRHETLKSIRETFYAENEDLKQFGDIVKLASSEVYAQNPNMPLREAMKEVARAARKKIATLRGGAPAPSNDKLPHAGAGGVSDGAGKSGSGEPKKPVLSEVEESVRDRIQAQQKKLAR